MPNRNLEREQFLADILICFVEDYGTNSWRQIKAGTYKPSSRDLGGEFDIPPNESRVTFIDIDDNNEYDVNIEVIAHGIRGIISGEIEMNDTMRGAIALANLNCDAGEIDAYDADMIVQAGVFERLIYG